MSRLNHAIARTRIPLVLEGGGKTATLDFTAADDLRRLKWKVAGLPERAGGELFCYTGRLIAQLLIANVNQPATTGSILRHDHWGALVESYELRDTLMGAPFTHVKTRGPRNWNWNQRLAMGYELEGPKVLDIAADADIAGLLVEIPFTFERNYNRKPHHFAWLNALLNGSTFEIQFGDST